MGRRLHHVGRGRHLRARANPLRGQRGARQEGNRGGPSQSSPGMKYVKSSQRYVFDNVKKFLHVSYSLIYSFKSYSGPAEAHGQVFDPRERAGQGRLQRRRQPQGGGSHPAFQEGLLQQELHPGSQLFRKQQETSPGS